MMELGNQLVVEGRGWHKIARLKEELPGGALGEGSRLLKMMLKDGSLLEFPHNFEAISLCKDIVASFGESDTSKIKSSSCSMGEVLPSENLFDKLTRFSSFLRMPVVGFENEIMSLLRKVDTRRGTEDMRVVQWVVCRVIENDGRKLFLWGVGFGCFSLFFLFFCRGAFCLLCVYTDVLFGLLIYSHFYL